VCGFPDGRSLNRELVREGYAWWYKQYSKDASLGVLEGEARAAKRGLWADQNPVPPWEWRAASRIRRRNQLNRSLLKNPNHRVPTMETPAARYPTRAPVTLTIVRTAP
jgi:hypothetical protein